MKSLIAVICLFFCFIQCAYPQQKKALIIGIDKYHRKAGEYNIDLAGSVNDALAVKAILKSRFGFKENEITTLFNESASRDSILKSMINLSTTANAGDIIFIYYAGHGISMYNSKSPKEGKSQGLVGSDVYRQASSVVMDNDQKRIFKSIIKKKAILTVMYDCCFSEGNTMASPFVIRPIDTIGRGRTFYTYETLPFAKDDSSETMINRSIPYDNENLNDATYESRPQEISNSNYLFLAATTDREESKERHDINNLPHGAFTAAFVEVMNKNPATIPADSILSRIRELLQKQYTLSQAPNLLSDPARKKMNLLGSNNLPVTAKFITHVSEIKNNKIYFDAGLVNGISPGNILTSTASGIKKKIKIEALVGMSHAVGSFVLNGGTLAEIKPGEEFEVTDWYASTDPMLNVYFPVKSCSLNEYNNFIKNVLIPAGKDHNFNQYVPEYEGISSSYNSIYYSDNTWMKRDITPTEKNMFQAMGKPVALFPALKPDYKRLKSLVNFKYFIYLPVPTEVYNILKAKLAKDQNVNFVSDPSKADVAFYGMQANTSKNAVFLCSKEMIGNKFDPSGHNGEKHNVYTDHLILEKKDIPVLADQLYTLLMTTASYKGWLNEYPKK